MDKKRRVTLSAASFVVICFFLPWIQVSCAGARDTASGFDLARDGEGVLWLVPISMLVVILLGILGVWKKQAATFALACTVTGALSAYLMNRERLEADELSAVIGAHVTGWFWLGFASSLGVAVSALLFWLRRPKSP
jgi:hypothetical protein